MGVKRKIANGKRTVEIGNVIEINEVENPWRNGPWRGEVLRLLDEGDAYVRPTEDYDKITNWRVRAHRDYVNKGLYLTRDDMAAAKVIKKSNG